MNLPGFTAERSLDPPRGRYRSSRHAASRSGTVVPAIPNCANCDYILDRCARNGNKPRAVCNACDAGNCYSEQDNSNCWIEPLTGRRICDL